MGGSHKECLQPNIYFTELYIMFKIPILYLVFNRPEETLLSFERIRNVRPEILFIAADAPREDVPSDVEKCNAVRKIIESKLDWNCEVKFLFRDVNLGCGKAVSQAIDWFFTHVEYGIILEDDCLPSESFFPFCAELLLRYKNFDKVSHISGHNYQMGYIRGKSDYYFSRVVNIWGWATWRRAWANYNFNYRDISLLWEHPKRDVFPISNMDDFIFGKIDTWDTQWLVTNFVNNFFAISPNVNLVQNIGFNSSATHTDFKPPGYFNKNLNGDLKFPLKHPKKILFDFWADEHAAAYIFKVKKASIILKIVNRLNLNFKLSL
jgi:hypothetical protein